MSNVLNNQLFDEDEAISRYEREQHEAYLASLNDPQHSHIGSWDAPEPNEVPKAKPVEILFTGTTVRAVRHLRSAADGLIPAGAKFDIPVGAEGVITSVGYLTDTYSVKFPQCNRSVVIGSAMFVVVSRPLPNLSAVLTDALDTFWETVAANFPASTSGDLSANTALDLRRAAETALNEWVELNVQKAGRVNG